MTEDWTLDTNVLYQVAKANWPATSLLGRILQRQQYVMFDQQGKIEKEYRACLDKTKNILLQKWFVEVVDKLATICDGNLTKKQRNTLKRLHFHNDDFPFVAVCCKSSQKRLVSEDSDYGEAVKVYLLSEMKVNVISVGDALKL
jgi:hypothetical protein